MVRSVSSMPRYHNEHSYFKVLLCTCVSSYVLTAVKGIVCNAKVKRLFELAEL
jgi:hypothetical protein